MDLLDFTNKPVEDTFPVAEQTTVTPTLDFFDDDKGGQSNSINQLQISMSNLEFENLKAL